MFQSTFYLYRLTLFVAGALAVVSGLAMILGFAAEMGDASRPSTPQTTFVVTTNADTNDGSCDAHCTLREAIVAANMLPGPDVILFSLPPASQIITLVTEMPFLEDDVTVDGSAALSLTISGNNLHRIFEIRPNVSVTLTHMSVISGFSTSGASGLNNVEGILTLNHVTLRGNRATNSSSFGGGVNNYQGILIVHHSTFVDNSAGHGGGIANQHGKLVVNDSYFEGNVAHSVGGAGGGIVSWGSYGSGGVINVISNTTFVENTAPYGGGLVAGGVLTLTHSSFSGNAATILGGGMINDAVAVISHTTFLSNTAVQHGGAIHNHHSLTVQDALFRGNTAGQQGGAIVNSDDFFPGTILVTHSLFQENVAGYGGGIANWTGDQVMVRNSTFSANQAITAGGGISSSQSLWLNNVTLSDNEAAVAGGIISSGVLTMSNSIIANSVGGDCAYSGLFNTNVHNLVEDGSCTPLLSGDPLLGLLADNGGATWTHALLPGSPALDAGDEATCELTDQRGVTRPLDGDGDGTAVCDMGAVEQELTNTPTPTPTYTSTPTPTNTPTPTPTNTPTPIPSHTPTHTPTNTPTHTPTHTPTYTPTPTPTLTPTATTTPPPPNFRVYLPVIWKEG